MGVAGSPAAVQNAVTTSAARRGVQLTSLNLDDVAPVGNELCDELDALRRLRADTAVSGLKIKHRPSGVSRCRNILGADRPSGQYAVINVNAAAQPRTSPWWGSSPPASWS